MLPVNLCHLTGVILKKMIGKCKNGHSLGAVIEHSTHMLRLRVRNQALGTNLFNYN